MEEVYTDTIKEGSIIHKAYEIDLSKLVDGYLSEPIVCYADTISKAKYKLLNDVKYDSWKMLYSNAELSYLNIPVKRCNGSDIILFEGREIARNNIQSIVQERERNNKLDNILNDITVEYCYIIKGSYYRPNACGYTSIKSEAGVYDKVDAVSHARGCGEVRLECIDKEVHNKMIREKITELESRIL